MRVGVDTGGTFTDVVADDGRIAKVASTPDDPARAIVDGLASLDAGQPGEMAHGTTVATNALLERTGAAVALVTTEGFADVIEIARQDRPSLYDPFADRPEPLVPAERRLEVAGRRAADGSVLDPVRPAEVPPVPEGTGAVAVCLLHADVDPSDERAVGAELRGRGLDVTLSSEVSPEFREYERTVTTVVNAYLRPVCRRYLGRLDAAAGRVEVMTSAGGMVDLARAGEVPAALLLSGPAGGVLAAAAAARANGFDDAVTLDMGGTSTDVCLVTGGRPEPASLREVDGYPVRLPSLDIHTIGAGGGSIARLDRGGALVVGPDSAGAVPGPACYGRGGTEPTVTDADLVLGRIDPDASFGGLRLDPDAAARALDDAGLDAGGVARVVDANMERALRTVTVERGVDPRGLALVAFGGAGPLHACALAEALDIASVVVPARAGVLSAVGLLCAPRQRDLVRSWVGAADGGDLDAARAELAEETAALLDAADPVVETWVDVRYAGQSHELTVPDVARFHDEHERRNGYRRDGWPVEVVAIRARATAPAGLTPGDLPVADRPGAAGPAVLTEADCTIWVAGGWRAEPGAGGALVLRRGPGS